MRRRDLEHVIRAAADIADDDEIIVIGSQAILGQYPDAPRELCVSSEADVYPKNKPERTDLIDGSIGGGWRPLSNRVAAGIDTPRRTPVRWRDGSQAGLRRHHHRRRSRGSRDGRVPG